MKQLCIYKITNPKGKVYIGQTTNFYERKRSYSYQKNKTQIKLYNSFVKYGYENHIFEIIEECSFENLDKREIYYKQYFINLIGWDNVLFCKIYDKKGGPLPQNIRNKIGMALKGKKHSKETKIKMSIKATGRKYTEEDKLKMSLSKKGKKFTNEQKINMKGRPLIPILQFDLKDNFIKEWSSSKEIKDVLGLHDSGIVNCCKGVQKTSKGYIWKYK